MCVIIGWVFLSFGEDTGVSHAEDSKTCSWWGGGEIHPLIRTGGLVLELEGVRNDKTLIEPLSQRQTHPHHATDWPVRSPTCLFADISHWLIPNLADNRATTSYTPCQPVVHLLLPQLTLGITTWQWTLINQKKKRVEWGEGIWRGKVRYESSWERNSFSKKIFFCCHALPLKMCHISTSLMFQWWWCAHHEWSSNLCSSTGITYGTVFQFSLDMTGLHQSLLL